MSTVPKQQSGINVFLTLLPISVSVFIAYLTIALPLPVLPLHLHTTLGASTLVVGIVLGSQFAAALLLRAWAGRVADIRGSKLAVIVGAAFATLSGITYLLSLAFLDAPSISIWVLLLGRLFLGCAESLIVAGSMSWGLGLVGMKNAGKVMAWTGAAIWGAYAVGAPIGVAIYNEWGFAGVGLATAVIPLIAVGAIVGVRPIAPMSARPVPFYRVLGSVWISGLGLSLSSVGLGAITAFIALLFAAKSWGSASLAFTAFGLAFIGARLFFSNLPDRLGGAKVALVCVLIETVGQLLIWGADSALIAYVGAAFTGFGFSLAFPGFGVEAVRRAPPQSRGVAMSAYVAFMDISMALTAPLAGALASRFGLNSVYIAGAAAVSCSALIALYLMLNKQPSMKDHLHVERGA